MNLPVKNIDSHENQAADVDCHQIGKILAYQGLVLNDCGLKLVEEAECLEGAKRLKRLAEATKMLASARTSLASAYSILEKYEQPPIKLQKAREELLQLAFDNGYEISFECDGRVTLEKCYRGEILPIEST